MNYTLALTPAGRLLIREREEGETAAPDGWITRVIAGFSLSASAGLFALAATRPDAPPPASFAFWRDFAGNYLTELCRTPEFAADYLQPVDPPPPAEMASMFLGAPPMPGGEYLTLEVLQALWIELDRWVRNEVSSSGRSLAAWLKKHASIYHQVGRICFHLAENKRDPAYPFAFLATYAPRLSRVGLVQYQSLGRALREYAGERNKKALIKLLSPVHLASEKSDFVRELVESGEVFHPLAWAPDEAYRFLKEVPLLEESGLLVRVPNWWRRRPRPQVSVTIGEKKQNRFGAAAMLDFKVGLALGDRELTEEEWRRIMESEDGLVYIKGQWVEIDHERLSRALEHWKRVERESARDGISFVEGMRLLAGAPADLNADAAAGDGTREWSFVNAGGWLGDILSGLRDPSRLGQGKKSRNFRGTLRPYQEIGHNWLWFLSNLGLGACLADDMGLGKTIQVLSLLLAIKEAEKPDRKPSLLVLPASLLANWKAEMKRFSPALTLRFVHPSETARSDLDAMAAAPKKAFLKTDVVLTTYGMLLRQKWLREMEWRLVILDEAQAIKNPSARQTRAVKELKADGRIVLTGTPVENRLFDLWSLFDFLCPGLLGSAAKFKKFVKAMERREHDRYVPLRNLVRPYILRRLKTDRSVIADLPDKTEMKVFCGLEKRQAGLYLRTVRELSRSLEGVGGMKRRGMVLSCLLRFKQICNHPSQLLGDGLYNPADSGKFSRLREICEEISSRQEKALIFTQFREMTDPLVSFLTEVFGREGLVLHGGTPVKKRRSLVDTFQREDGPPFFVLSLRAAGTGLNLTEASHVIHFDRWWNPAVENQATDRAFRIGQNRNVVVHKFICRGTVEEKIDALIEEKTKLADGILSGGAETMLTEMSDEELLDIVSLDMERARF
ncbi:MAG: DEAD/DEAH box helicase [Candidatus Euphemobacter frigidus]|nr:DEAD/DEAH box helicase [Candidatus Euphemobacter frigidus]MDP8276408.1 DEAD/DEAH box helicase [Candidatus Euphemobacter frigidus]